MAEEWIGLIGGKSGDSLTDKLQEKGYKVALVAGRAGEPGTDSADRHYIIDLREADAVADFFRKCQVKKVLVGTGHEVVFELAKKLEEEGFVLSINLATSLLAKDKIAFKKQLEKQGILTPAYYTADREKDVDMKKLIAGVGIPCVIKSSTDAIQPRKVNRMEELEEAVREVFATGTSLLAEEFIDGGDCTVAVANDGEHLIDCGVLLYSKARGSRLKGFHNAKDAVLSEEQKTEVAEIAKRVVGENGLLGLARVDFSISDENYVLEANSVVVTGYHGNTYPRYKKNGVDLAEILVEYGVRILERKSVE